MSAGCPYEMHGIIARVRGVIAAAIFSGSMVNETDRCRRTPARSGVADRRCRRDEGEGGVMTSSPGRCRRRAAPVNALVPEFTAIRARHRSTRELAFERLDFGARCTGRGRGRASPRRRWRAGAGRAAPPDRGTGLRCALACLQFETRPRSRIERLAASRIWTRAAGAAVGQRRSPRHQTMKCLASVFNASEISSCGENVPAAVAPSI